MTNNPCYLIAKYVPDVTRWEPKNIGVIVWSEHGLRSKFIGEKDANSGSIDGRRIPGYIQSDNAFMQWVSYWTNLIAKPQLEKLSDESIISSTDPAVINAIKETASGNFLLEDGGFLLDPIEADQLEDLTDYLYASLVTESIKELKDNSLNAIANDVFKTAGVFADPNFSNDYEVSCKLDNKVQPLKFSHAYKNGSLSLIQRVPLAKNLGAADKIFSATFRFQTVIEQNVIDKDHGISLIYLTDKDKSLTNTLEFLHSVSHVYNLGKESQQKNLVKKLDSLRHGA